MRVFGNYDNKRWQFNFAFFDMREKDTYSGLNEFDSRDQQILVLNLYRQEFLAHDASRAEAVNCVPRLLARACGIV